MSILRLHWDNNLAFAADYAAQVLGDAGDGHVCFKTALVGTGPLSRRIPGTEAWPYREAAVWRLGLQEEPQERPVITVLKKKGGMTILGYEKNWKHIAWMRPGRRSVENTEDVVSALQARYGYYAAVHLLECCDGDRMTVPDQVKLMSATSVLISPGGGIASVLNFLRPSATAVPLTAFNTQTNRSVSLDYVFYPQMETPRIVEFPVSLKEYEKTSDRPGCELPTDNWRYAMDGALIHCNLRFGPEGTQRLMQHVDAALLHWAERNGRYEVLQPLQKLAAAQAARPT
ncbi:isoforms B C isoform X1 [Micractinium conductrix]|uniref:Isoforms B C isoform X1 n=1 Tax=Micractinium conductrix TaxID=554055 RepID=A0A2P6V7N6_9CHLO|nr:isoforms B C isoform X1 [Micractinium conductrix]|eukprot:PSC70088.1 isoforms B C isoform X1 [Micractinium conductrix]